jgi:hypothetical protein
MLTRAHLMDVISEVIDRPLDDQSRTLSWPELGVDSVSATELLIHLEEVLHTMDARGIEAALYLSSTPDELAARLTELSRA